MKHLLRIIVPAFVFAAAALSPWSARAETCTLKMEKAYKHPNASTVYYVTTDCTKRAFKRADIFFTYFDSFNDVKTVVQSTLDGMTIDPLGFMPWGPKYDPKYGALVKIVKDPKVYLLLGLERYWITNEQVFNGLNYQWNWIEDVDPRLLDSHAVGSEITYTDHHPNHTVVKYASGPEVYVLEPDPANASRQIKRYIENEQAFNQLGFRWDRIVTIPASEQYADGTVLAHDDLTAWRNYAFNDINRIRRENGQDPLVMNDQLNEIAQRHSDDMATYIKEMSHDGSLGEKADERIKEGKVPNIQTHALETVATPLNIGWSGENVGMRDMDSYNKDVEQSIAAQHEWFMDEPDNEFNHRTTMLSSMAPFTEIGIGLTLDSQNRIWITEDFISRM
jgi:uncharacterized protein YkwD